MNADERSKKFSTIDEYIAQCQPRQKKLLKELRKIIREAAPAATEVISYNMPAFKQKKVLVYFAAYEHHIGFYPTASPMAAFADALSAYKTSKGAIQFPIEGDIPAQLVKDIVAFKLAEEAANATKKKAAIRSR